MSPEEYREFLKAVKPGPSPLPKSQLSGKARLPRYGRTYRTDAMNQTEARYAGYLDGMKHTGEVVAWAYEAMKLRLADKTFYTPDFVVIRADGGIELHEVKGHWEDDARVKIKVAATQHPWFRFLAVKAGKTGWQYETFGGGA